MAKTVPFDHEFVRTERRTTGHVGTDDRRLPVMRDGQHEYVFSEK
jgi:hypothetical protein